MGQPAAGHHAQSSLRRWLESAKARVRVQARARTPSHTTHPHIQIHPCTSARAARAGRLQPPSHSSRRIQGGGGVGVRHRIHRFGPLRRRSGARLRALAGSQPFAAAPRACRGREKAARAPVSTHHEDSD